MKALRSLIGRTGRRLARDERGASLLEFAFTLPLLLTLSLTGAELTNFVITKMRVSQIALQLADNAARIGTGTQLASKKITEYDINDLLSGADLQSGELALLTNGRIILSSVEPDPANSGKNRIRWQRCKGSQTSWATANISPANGTTNLAGVGPTGRQITAPTGGVTMFVEVRYKYTPLVKTSLSPNSEITETASMMVRDRRDTSGGTNGVYPATGSTASTC